VYRCQSLESRAADRLASASQARRNLLAKVRGKTAGERASNLAGGLGLQGTER
jgi:hypothetical protein